MLLPVALRDQSTPAGLHHKRPSKEDYPESSMIPQLAKLTITAAAAAATTTTTTTTHTITFGFCFFHRPIFPEINPG